MTNAEERPFASVENERRVGKTFPIDLTPEEFAARDGHGWLDFPFDRFRYRNVKLDAWIQEVGKIIKNPSLMRQCQKKFLTGSQHAATARHSDQLDELVDEDD